MNFPDIFSLTEKIVPLHLKYLKNIKMIGGMPF